MIFCTGASGTGKSTFIDKYLSGDNFYNLKSATTRPMRDDGKDCDKYYFRDEEYFDTKHFATLLFVNERIWKPGDKKWLYGVPEFEIFDNLGCNFTYDVIEPKYVRQMEDWFRDKGLNKYYNFKILWFQPYADVQNIVESRQNMPNDKQIRKDNTCTLEDFQNAHLRPDFSIKRMLPEGYEIYKKGKPSCLSYLVNEIKSQIK